VIGGGIAPPAPHGVLYLSREGDAEAAGAAVAGLPVAVRSVMAAVRAGCSTVILPSSLRSHDIARAIDRRPAARAAVRWLDQGRLPPGPGRVLLIPATVVVTRASLKALLAERGPVVLAGSPPEAPVAVIDSDQIDTAGDALACGQPSAVALRAAREARPVTGAQGSWCVQARDAAGRQEAQRRLFASLGAPVDSWFDRTVHRRASAPLTRIAVALGVSPNAVSLASLALGLGAVAGWASATLGGALLGLLLYFLSVVLDHTDGEVARLTHTESRFGEWLDVTLDTVVHVLGGLAFGLAAQHAAGSGALAGVLAAAGFAASAVVTKASRQILREDGDLGRIVSVVGTRDGYYILAVIFAAALALAPGTLPALVLLAAVGSHVYWIVALAVRLRRRRATLP
jgi:phosphatidylglycerophosphate synthase